VRRAICRATGHLDEIHHGDQVYARTGLHHRRGSSTIPANRAREAGPWAIAEFLDFLQGSHFLQSFKPAAASRAFEHATIFEKRLRFEEPGHFFLDRLCTHAADALKVLPPRVVVDRPVNYVGNDRTVKLARQRYDLVFAALEREVHYVYEPLGATSASSRVSISLQIEGSA
jgi:hypothetical chaperone protein